MTIQTATPYLMFDGKTDSAIALYTTAFAAKVEARQRFGDVDGSCGAARKDRVMHAVIRIGNAQLMMSDGPGQGTEHMFPPSDAISVALDLDDVAEAHTSFDALARSGQVINPLFEAPWGALFGVVKDEFGISWIFNVQTTKPA